MFKNIEHIQSLIHKKCEDFDAKIYEAEDAFKHRLNIAIRENKKLKKELRENIKTNLFNANIADQFKNRK